MSVCRECSANIAASNVQRVRLALIAAGTFLAGLWLLIGCDSRTVEPLFVPSDGTYNYSPSIMQFDETTRIAYYCTNTRPYVIRDSIGFREARLIDGVWEWGPEQIVLSPGNSEWDQIHVCDPSIVAGEFADGDATYEYALFYLGCDTLDVTHNQVGVAFSDTPAGPWHKLESNPVAPYEPRDSWWGTGQPSAVSVDGAGLVMLFYTRGDADGTRVVARELDLADLKRPSIGAEFPVTAVGLTTGDGSQPVFHNADFAGLPDGGYAVVRSRHPFDPEFPSFIASEVQLALMEGNPVNLWNGEWQLKGNTGPNETDWPRNHNAAIVRDRYGRIQGDGPIELAISLSQLGPNSLWTYRIGVIEVR